MADDELKRGELVTLSDSDGQQYVVLEVIQLEDGTEQQVAVVAPNSYMEDDEDMEEEEEEEEEVKQVLGEKALENKNGIKNIKVENGVDSCFGFDEEDEAEEEICFN